MHEKVDVKDDFSLAFTKMWANADVLDNSYPYTSDGKFIHLEMHQIETEFCEF